MPRLVGIVERLDHVLYSAWIADTRPCGIGVSNEVQFRNPMRLFATDLGDKRRTNMMQPCALSSDRAASIRKVGFHASFSNPKDFDLAFNYHNGVSFEVNVGGVPSHRIDTVQDHRIIPTYSYGIRHLEHLDQPIDIGGRESFFVAFSCDKEVEERMRIIESGKAEEYAEFKSILDITMAREVQ